MASNLQRQIRQLEELSRVQQQFVSDVSHELRTPLTTVRMAGDVLHDARGPSTRPRRARPSCCRRSSTGSRRCSVDLLEISRFDAGAAVLDLDEVNLVDVAHRVVDQTRALADQRHTRVVVDAPDHACLAEADVRRVERIVRNLVTNAIDHAETESTTSSSTSPATTGGGDRGPRPRRRPAPGRVGDGVQPVLAGRPGPGADQRRHRARPVDLPRGHPPPRRLAAGVGAAGEGSQFRLTLPRDARGCRCARARSRSSRWTPARRWLRRALLLVAALLMTLLATTACVGVPDTGPVVSADDQVRTQPEADVERRAQRPQEGQSAQEVVTGVPAGDDGVPRAHRRGPAVPGHRRARRLGSVAEGHHVRESRQHHRQQRGQGRPARGALDRQPRELARASGRPATSGSASRSSRRATRSASPPRQRVDRPRRLVPGPLRPASIYYLDPTARILVPEPVFVPTDQVAAALVQRPARRAEPGAEGRGPVVRAAGPDPGLSVPVSEDGVATVTLGGRSGAAHAGGLEADGLPVRVDPAAGRTRHDLQHHHRRPAGDHGGRHVAVQRRARLGVRAVRRAGELVAVPAAGRPARVRGLDHQRPVDGPLGQTQYGVEQVSVSLTAGLAASISGGGTALSLSSVNDQTHPWTRCSAGPPACSRRRGTSPTACGWWTRRPTAPGSA